MKTSSCKEKYKLLTATNSSIPIYSKAWWLDATCGLDDWNVALSYDKQGNIIGSMPYTLKKQGIFNIIGQGKIGQSLGPWIKYPSQKYHEQLAFQKNVMNDLIEQLPPFHAFSQNWSHSLTNWLPFYWKGFKQSTRYTYILPNIRDTDCIFKGLQPNIRREIKKAESRFSLNVRDDLPIDDLINLLEKTFSRQKMSLPVSRKTLHRLDQICNEKQCRMILIAEDPQGKHYSGAYIVWDDNYAYYLFGGSDTELRNSGSMSLVLWEGIKRSAYYVNSFDFEGSMLEPVERYFRAFNAVQTPYFNVYQSPSLAYKVYERIRSKIGNK